MLLLGILVISCLTTSVVPQHGHHGLTKMCRRCDLSRHEECHTFEKCPDEQCSVEVRVLANGDKLWAYGCKGHHECDHPVNVLELLAKGKRQPHHHDETQRVCFECCNTNLCNTNDNLCSNYKPTVATTKATTVKPATQKPTTQKPTTAAPATTAQPSCHNDEAVFHCSELDKYNFCTDTSSVAYAIAHEHCALYCGFCGPNAVTTPAPVDVTDVVNIIFNVTQIPVIQTSASQVACVDVEDPTLSCMELKNLGFCAPGSGTGHTFAELRCPKTCDLCPGIDK